MEVEHERLTSAHPDSLRTLVVHLVELGGPHWVSNLALRDYLRASPEAARRYEAAKRAAIAAGATTLQAYSKAKGAILSALLGEALGGRTRGPETAG